MLATALAKISDIRRNLSLAIHATAFEPRLLYESEQSLVFFGSD